MHLSVPCTQSFYTRKLSNSAAKSCTSVSCITKPVYASPAEILSHQQGSVSALAFTHHYHIDVSFHHQTMYNLSSQLIAQPHTTILSKASCSTSFLALCISNVPPYLSIISIIRAMSSFAFP